MNRRHLVTVTDGKELYKVSPEQLPKAVARGLTCPVFWEIFAGACVMTGAFSDTGWQTAPPLDDLDASILQ